MTDLEVTQTVNDRGDTIVLIIRAVDPSHYITDKDLLDSLRAYMDYIKHSADKEDGH